MENWRSVRDGFKKQATPLESRWLYDALHESGHIKNGDVTDDQSLVEDQEISPESSGPEEEAANEWAEDTLFDSRSDAIEDAITEACRGRLQSLKAALPRVAQDYNINVGALANYMAYRLAQQRENWWGAAHGLQDGGKESLRGRQGRVARMHEYLQVVGVDRALLQRALNDESYATLKKKLNIGCKTWTVEMVFTASVPLTSWWLKIKWDSVLNAE